MEELDKVKRILDIEGNVEVALIEIADEIEGKISEIEQKIEAEIKSLNKLIGEKEAILQGKIDNIQLLKGDKGDSIKGDKGDSPTRDELLSIIKPLISKAEKGSDGRSPMFAGKNPPKNPQKGDLWYQDYSSKLYLFDGNKWIEIAKNGLDGLDADEDRIIQKVIKRIPKPKDGIGRIPKHEWSGSYLRFELPNGKWGEWKNLQGERGLIYGNVTTTEVYNQTMRCDLSGQCDGNNKVFIIDHAYEQNSVQLFSTQFPIVYRPDIDFTEDGGNQITLTSEVGAPETGQTLIAIYAKKK